MRGRRLAAALAVLAAGSASAVPFSGRAYVGSKPQRNAVVWLEAPGAPEPRTPPRAVLDQRNMEFLPHVLAVRVGTVVDFPNNDRVFHNVFSFHDGKKFDLGLYPVGAIRKITFDKPGLSRIFCNIHPHMAAYVMAVATPYFAVSDRKGAFTLPDVPAGQYTYRAWRPGGSEVTGKVTVGPGQAFEVRWP